ncbi:hypothetical protein ACH4UM_21465 [Streptomyces sp. NPDC020801]|uniref:hypothetical protein n=1 Tax=unclassified Streptomyces TaxID=2593676 RepID=UPI0037997706
MNLDDLDAFVQDVRRSGATGTEEVMVRMSWSGKLQKLAVEVEMAPTSRPTLDNDSHMAP